MATDMSTIEQRLSALESAVAQIERRLASRPVSPDWLQRLIGSISDKEAFDEVVELGRQFRYADRPKDDEPAT